MENASRNTIALPESFGQTLVIDFESLEATRPTCQSSEGAWDMARENYRSNKEIAIVIMDGSSLSQNGVSAQKPLSQNSETTEEYVPDISSQPVRQMSSQELIENKNNGDDADAELEDELFKELEKIHNEGLSENLADSERDDQVNEDALLEDEEPVVNKRKNEDTEEGKFVDTSSPLVNGAKELERNDFSDDSFHRLSDEEASEKIIQTLEGKTAPQEADREQISIKQTSGVDSEPKGNLPPTRSENDLEGVLLDEESVCVEEPKGREDETTEEVLASQIVVNETESSNVEADLCGGETGNVRNESKKAGEIPSGAKEEIIESLLLPEKLVNGEQDHSLYRGKSTQQEEVNTANQKSVQLDETEILDQDQSGETKKTEIPDKSISTEPEESKILYSDKNIQSIGTEVLQQPESSQPKESKILDQDGSIQQKDAESLDHDKVNQLKEIETSGKAAAETGLSTEFQSSEIEKVTKKTGLEDTEDLAPEAPAYDPDRYIKQADDILRRKDVEEMFVDFQRDDDKMETDESISGEPMDTDENVLFEKMDTDESILDDIEMTESIEDVEFKDQEELVVISEEISDLFKVERDNQEEEVKLTTIKEIVDEIVEAATYGRTVKFSEEVPESSENISVSHSAELVCKELVDELVEAATSEKTVSHIKELQGQQNLNGYTSFDNNATNCGAEAIIMEILNKVVLSEEKLENLSSVVQENREKTNLSEGKMEVVAGTGSFEDIVEEKLQGKEPSSAGDELEDEGPASSNSVVTTQNKLQGEECGKESDLLFAKEKLEKLPASDVLILIDDIVTIILQRVVSSGDIDDEYMESEESGGEEGVFEPNSLVDTEEVKDVDRRVAPELQSHKTVTEDILDEIISQFGAQEENLQSDAVLAGKDQSGHGVEGCREEIEVSEPLATEKTKPVACQSSIRSVETVRPSSSIQTERQSPKASDEESILDILSSMADKMVLEKVCTEVQLNLPARTEPNLLLEEEEFDLSEELKTSFPTDPSQICASILEDVIDCVVFGRDRLKRSREDDWEEEPLAKRFGRCQLSEGMSVDDDSSNGGYDGSQDAAMDSELERTPPLTSLTAPSFIGSIVEEVVTDVVRETDKEVIIDEIVEIMFEMCMDRFEPAIIARDILDEILEGIGGADEPSLPFILSATTIAPEVFRRMKKVPSPTKSSPRTIRKSSRTQRRPGAMLEVNLDAVNSYIKEEPIELPPTDESGDDPVDQKPILPTPEELVTRRPYRKRTPSYSPPPRKRGRKPKVPKGPQKPKSAPSKSIPKRPPPAKKGTPVVPPAVKLAAPLTLFPPPAKLKAVWTQKPNVLKKSPRSSAPPPTPPPPPVKVVPTARKSTSKPVAVTKKKKPSSPTPPPRRPAATLPPSQPVHRRRNTKSPSPSPPPPPVTSRRIRNTRSPSPSPPATALRRRGAQSPSPSPVVVTQRRRGKSPPSLSPVTQRRRAAVSPSPTPPVPASLRRRGKSPSPSPPITSQRRRAALSPSSPPPAVTLPPPTRTSLPTRRRAPSPVPVNLPATRSRKPSPAPSSSSVEEMSVPPPGKKRAILPNERTVPPPSKRVGIAPVAPRKTIQKNIAVKSTATRPQPSQVAKKRTMSYFKPSEQFEQFYDRVSDSDSEPFVPRPGPSNVAGRKRPAPAPEKPQSKRPKQLGITIRPLQIRLERMPYIDRLLPSSKKSNAAVNCELCEPARVFVSRQGLVDHLKAEHADTFGGVPLGATADRCPGCDKKYHSQNRLATHMKICPSVAALSSGTSINIADLQDRGIQLSKSSSRPVGEVLRHTCEFCGWKFSLWSAYESHKRTHWEQGEARNCRFCDETFRKTSDLVNHLFTHGLTKSEESAAISALLGSVICVNKQLKKSEFEEDELNGNNDEFAWEPEIFECDKCKRTFTISEVYNRHLRVRKQAEKLLDPSVCPQCGFKSESVCLMGAHLESNIHKIDVGSSLYCKLCDKTFRSVNTLIRHNLQHEGKLNSSCEFCNSYFNSIEELNTHRESCTFKNKPYECEECKRVFNSRWRFQEHSHLHQAKVYFCDQCGREFRHLNHLNRHVGSKCGTEPVFHCSDCGQKYFNRKSLAAHQRHQHTTEKLFICQYCSREYLMKSQLIRHEARHNQLPKTYSCSFSNCEMTYKSLSRLRAHESGHISFQYGCRTCASQFSTSNALQAHSAESGHVT